MWLSIAALFVGLAIGFFTAALCQAAHKEPPRCSDVGDCLFFKETDE